MELMMINFSHNKNIQINQFYRKINILNLCNYYTKDIMRKYNECGKNFIYQISQTNS